MPAKPTAGHPTQADACAALARDGLTSREIGARLGIPTCDASSAVAYRLGKAGIVPAPPRGRRLPRPSEADRRTVQVDADVLAALEPAAARRGIGIPALVRRLLDLLVEHPALLDNVLDDAADLPPQPRQEPA